MPNTRKNELSAGGWSLPRATAHGTFVCPLVLLLLKNAIYDDRDGRRFGAPRAAAVLTLHVPLQKKWVDYTQSLRPQRSWAISYYSRDLAERRSVADERLPETQW